MSLLKKLQLGDNELHKYTKEYLLADYKFHTYRKHNEYRPNAEKYCERIELTVIAPGREDVTLYEWFINQSTQNGRVLIMLPPQPDSSIEETREVVLENATCFSLEEDFHIGHNQRRMLRLSLVAEEVHVEDIVFKRL